MSTNPFASYSKALNDIELNKNKKYKVNQCIPYICNNCYNGVLISQKSLIKCNRCGCEILFKKRTINGIFLFF